jgi:dipeptide/tripeptide permease
MLCTPHPSHGLSGLCICIAQEYGYFAVYMIASCIMTLAFIIFLASSKRYVKKPASGDPLRGLLYYIAKGAGTGMKVRRTSYSAWPVMLAHAYIHTVCIRPKPLPE